MTGSLLLRGMIVGFVAALLSFGFLKLVGEPAVGPRHCLRNANGRGQSQGGTRRGDRQGPSPAQRGAEPELVSRAVQGGIGLFTGVAVYSVAFGGLFALVYALAYGRMGDFSPRATAALIAVSGFVALYVVPNLKYPANPPSVGNPDTIGMRTALYFVMMLLSLAAMIAAWSVRNRLLPQHGAWNATLIAGAAYIVAVVLLALAMPPLNEVPEGFPAVVLWQFRMASLGAQAIMWTVLGLGFGALVERELVAKAVSQAAPHEPEREA